MRELVIDGQRIADDTECYVIAEVGHNHKGCVETCKKLFDAAKASGCHAVKLQKRENKALYAPEMYDAPYNSENAFGPTYGTHREALEFDKEQYELLKCYAESIGLTFFATAFDIPSLIFLARLNVPAIKIASGDLTNEALLKEAAKIGKPIILSTGGGSMTEVLRAREILHYVPHAILQCTSGYPASYDELNLSVIETFRAALPRTVIGWSAHDTGTTMALCAYALGARIIEKHFTLDRAWKGTDQAMSLEPKGMAYMIENLRLAKRSMGDGIKRRYASENQPLLKQEKNESGQIDGKPKLRAVA
jgi:sialic acid synthase